MKKPYLLFFILIVTLCFGQNKQADSLWAIYNNKNLADTGRLNALHQIAWGLRVTNPDTAIVLVTQELKLIGTLSNQNKSKYQANAFFGMAICLTYKGDYQKAIDFFLKALQLRKKINDKQGIADCFRGMGNVYWSLTEYKKSLDNYAEDLKIRNELNDKKEIAFCYRNIGAVYVSLFDDVQALDYFLKALKLREEITDKQGIADCYNSIGNVYLERSDFPNALSYYLKSLKITEEINDKEGQGYCYNLIGLVYDNQSNFDKALEYYFKALKIRLELGNKKEIAACYVDIGIAYYNQHNYNKALEYYTNALHQRESIKDKKGVGACYINIANVYQKQVNYNRALDYYLKALQLLEQTGDKEGVGVCYDNLSELYIHLSDYTQAKQYSNMALEVNKEIGNIEGERLAYQNLATAYSKTGMYKDAYECHVKFKMLTDSIFNAENSKQLGDMKTQFEVQKKEAELKAKAEAQQAISIEEKKRQQLVIYAVVVVLLIVMIFSFFLYKRFLLTNKQKQIIEIKSKETEEQKHLVEEKQKEIIDSITYAKRVQQAILPSDETIKKHIPDNFIYYQPKDIVAGDFYWMEHLDGITFIAAADSTGHGVPGAMVSVVCSNALNRAVKEFGLRSTGKILDKTRELVLETFEKSGEEIKDGMDISLLALDKNKQQIYWSGANNQLWYIANNELKEITANKQPIGKTDNPQPFTTHLLELHKDDIIYLMTDGYPDQFGGPKGKKFKYKQLQEILLANSNKPLEEQKNILKQSFNSWKGSLDQVDDVTIIGIRV